MCVLFHCVHPHKLKKKQLLSTIQDLATLIWKNKRRVQNEIFCAGQNRFLSEVVRVIAESTREDEDEGRRGWR